MMIIFKIAYIIITGIVLKLFHNERVLPRAMKTNLIIQKNLWLGVLIIFIVSLLWPVLVIMAIYQVLTEEI